MRPLKEYLELFSMNYGAPNDNCKITGSIQKGYDKFTRSNYCGLDFDAICKLQLPKNEKFGLGLPCSIVLIQV